MSVLSVLPTLTVPERFRGPEQSANGGYMCGRVAGYLDGPVTVTLRQPPPLATPMTVEADADGSLRIGYDGTLVAEAAAAAGGLAVSVPEAPSPAEARAAQGRSSYYQNPMFPTCFVCGPQRGPGDGLRIFPGPVPGRGLWTAPWTPDASVASSGRSVRPEIVWSALDCPSGIAAAEAAEVGDDTAILLGRMTATVADLPVVGDEYQVLAWPIEQDGRKLTAGSALVGPGGEVLASAWALWLTVPRPAGEAS
jgi:hypothetical protein